MAGDAIVNRVYARIGLLGNPSDGFGGKCLSLSLKIFYAEVTLTPHALGITFEPNPESDVSSFAGLEQFRAHIDGAGYYGGLRLLMATVKCFTEYCSRRGIALDRGKGFSLAYTTNIPRQRGLGGSSAVACAALNCLLSYYDVGAQVPVANRPALLLSIEEELGIAAGLQDRVIQVYGGLVFMDFSQQSGGEPVYQSLDPGLLPPLHLIYSAAPSGKDSGRVHSDFKRRWEKSEEGAVGGLMAELAELAQRGKHALLASSAQAPQALAELMRRNFTARRGLFGDAALGAGSIGMVEVAASAGAAAKLTGSGGAVVALCPEGGAQAARLQAACQAAGLVCDNVQVGPVLHTAGGGAAGTSSIRWAGAQRCV